MLHFLFNSCLLLLYLTQQNTFLQTRRIISYIVNRDVKILRKRKNYKEQAKKFIDDQLKDPQYFNKFGAVHDVKSVGTSGDMAAVSKHSKEISWKATSLPDGPMYQKRYQEYLDNLPKGPTEEELAQMEKERYEKEIWIKIQKMGKTLDGQPFTRNA